MSNTAELQDALAAVINRSLNGLDAAASFVKEQLPDVISQLLVWTIAVNIIHISLWVILLLITVGYGVRLRKRGIKHVTPNQGLTLGGTIHIILIFAVLIAIPTAVVGAVTETIKVVVAPKLFLIDYVKDLSKSGARISSK